MKKLLLITSLSVLMLSCMTTKTPIGKYIETPGKEYTYAKGKQFWVFWGILPAGRTNVHTPSDGNCQVITKYTFIDLLISGLTRGIVTSYTIKVEAKKPEEQ